MKTYGKPIYTYVLNLVNIASPLPNPPKKVHISFLFILFKFRRAMSYHHYYDQKSNITNHDEILCLGLDSPFSILLYNT